MVQQGLMELSNMHRKQNILQCKCQHIFKETKATDALKRKEDSKRMISHFFIENIQLVKKYQGHTNSYQNCRQL
jgi:hypothetical protein